MTCINKRKKKSEPVEPCGAKIDKEREKKKGKQNQDQMCYNVVTETENCTDEVRMNHMIMTNVCSLTFNFNFNFIYFHKNKTSNNIKQRKPYGGVGWKANKACK